MIKEIVAQKLTPTWITSVKKMLQWYKNPRIKRILFTDTFTISICTWCHKASSITLGSPPATPKALFNYLSAPTYCLHYRIKKSQEPHLQVPSPSLQFTYSGQSDSNPASFLTSSIVSSEPAAISSYDNLSVVPAS